MMLALAIYEAIMNKSLLTIIVALAIAFSSVPSRAGDNYIYKIMTCFHGHSRHSDRCSLPDTGRRYRSLEECARTADALNGNNRMDRHISYKCFPPSRPARPSLRGLETAMESFAPRFGAGLFSSPCSQPD